MVANDLRPERDMVVSVGRPVRVVDISYHKANPLEWDSYGYMIWAPNGPLIFYGPAVRLSEAPEMSPRFNSIGWWKVDVCYRI